MNLARALRLGKTPCLAASGAGGKTTALFQLARELPPPVIVTASTHLHVDQIRLADSHRMVNAQENLAEIEGNLRGVMLITGSIEGDRTTGLNKSLIQRLHAVCNKNNLPLLIEADGSRQHPLKAPGEHEPVIPRFVDMVLVVIGMSGLGKPLTEEYVHRPETFSRLSGVKIGESITTEALARFLTHPAGGLKGIPAGARRVALLNQADTPELMAQAKWMAEEILPAYQSVITASLHQQSDSSDQRANIHAVREPVAGIILAAGEARRFGQLKQLLPLDGKPFVRRVAETALAAGLSPVVVVTGAGSETVNPALHDLPVIVQHNPDWKNGQSSSIRAGLGALPPDTGATIFLLADQPMITPTILRALVERHSLDLSPIVAPQVQGQRANPVLFDRVIFPDLLLLSGDVGGRGIFSKFPPVTLPWHDENLLVDIDTPDDLRKLMNDR